MAAYIARRILLMVPTLFGIMLVTFVVTQFVPGGPVERMLAEIEGHSTTGLSTGKGEVRVMPKSNLYQGAQGLDNERLEKLRVMYGFDKPPAERFMTMMKLLTVAIFLLSMTTSLTPAGVKKGLPGTMPLVMISPLTPTLTRQRPLSLPISELMVVQVPRLISMLLRHF